MNPASALAGSAINALDGVQLADALRAGIYRLFEKTDHINKINVFPVPDGDTGTNMSMTLAAVLAAVERSPQDHAVGCWSAQPMPHSMARVATPVRSSRNSCSGSAIARGIWRRLARGTSRWRRRPVPAMRARR